MDTKYAVLLVAAIIAAIFLYVHIREKYNLKKAESGEDMERLKRAVAQALPGVLGYRVAYAHWEKVEHFGRRTRTTYYCYALAFDAERLWVIPLRFENGGILTAQPVLLTSDALGIAEVSSLLEKDGEPWRVDITLHDKDGVELLRAYVDATNTREDRFHHLNILQREECGQFSRFITPVSSRVNRENADLRDRLADDRVKKVGKRVLIIGIIGLALCIVAPFFSIILGCIGVYTAPKPGQTGGRATAPLILSILSLALGVLFCVGWVLLMLSL